MERQVWPCFPSGLSEYSLSWWNISLCFLLCGDFKQLISRAAMMAGEERLRIPVLRSGLFIQAYRPLNVLLLGGSKQE